MLQKLLSHIEKNGIKTKIPPWLIEHAGMKKSKSDKFICSQIKSILKNPEQKPAYKLTDMKLLQIFLQHFTAYDGFNGSLTKTIAVLPVLAEAGFNSLMLLPHFFRSEKFKKGNRGSPYSVKDYYTIDPELNDLENFSTDDLFSAFIEACHRLGILVFIDMVPRTAARDSQWILENPDWFYWIRPENSEKLVELLQTPVPQLGSPAPPTREFGRIMIEHLPVPEIAQMFSHSPKRLAPEKWAAFVERNHNNPDFLDELVKEFNLITPPCTSDCANDPQPPWSDVTPLRLYEDYDPVFYEIFGKENLELNPAFFIQPVLKASNFFGNIPSPGLWEKITGVCKYYTDKFGIDGVRGDMFHALPDALIKGMCEGLPEDFSLIMENLFNEEGEELAVKHNFHFYTGNLFTIVDEGIDSIDYFLRQTAPFKTKILAMPVIGDSMPLFGKGEDIAKFQLGMAAFIANSAYGLTADTLLQNPLPLNFGLGFTTEMQEYLAKEMKKHGRTLAYFNYDYLTETWNSMTDEKMEFVKQVNEVRSEIFDGRSWQLSKIEKITGQSLYYVLTADNEALTVILNTGEPIQLTLLTEPVCLLNSIYKGQALSLGTYGIALVKE